MEHFKWINLGEKQIGGGRSGESASYGGNRTISKSWF